MSLKDIFGSTDSKRNYLSEDTQQDAFTEVESARNVSAVQTDQQAFVPSLDYHNPNTFSRFGSAYYYYKGAIERVLDYYPYDGSDAEINEFHNRSLDIEKYIFNNLYPRTTGYVKLAVDGWGALVGSQVDGYGVSDTPEYITFYGGPGTGSVASGSALSLFSINTDNNKPHQANVYDESIYRTAGLPLDYGSGSRESNLKSDFDTGVTLEFWLTTGSANTVTTAKTEKQVVVDVWNSNLSSSHDYGRITLALDADPGSGSPILLTAQSGTAGIFEQVIGTNALTADTLAAWHHYAVVLYNSGSDLISQLYLDGVLDQQTTHASAKLGALTPKDLQGRLGSLLTAPSGTAETAGIEPSAMATSGKLTGSMDEFRFWKARRTGKEVGEHWFSQVRGGTNTDISNTTLGIYYKFNEGVTLTSSIDSVVLDYSGRISNGVWTGYGSNSRNSGSAILSASAASKEYEDPIVRSSNPSVVTLKTSLLEKGNYHDSNNNAAFMNYVPSWVIEEHEEEGNENLKVISHIAGAYFDKLHAMAGALPQVKTANYPSASYKPIPFAEHLPQSLGLYTPELFVDASVLEKFANRDKDSFFEGDLTETKNLIYTNLYNNLTNIYKAKGTEKALRNVLRCFHIDERLIKVNVYTNNQTFQLQNNVEQVITNKKVLNFNKKANRTGVVYQAASGSESRGYISGTYGAWTLAGTPPEALYGMTLESDIILPRYYSTPNAEFDRKYTTVSLFGMATAQTASAAGLSGQNPTCLIPGDDEFDVSNLQVFAVKEAIASKNVYFKLTSSYGPVTLPELTSSVFFDAYDDTQWNLSVRVKPSMPFAGYLTSMGPYTYDVIFHGTNVIYGDVKNSFTVTGSMTKAAGTSFLEAAKRVYAGAQRTNLTGALVAYSDAYLSSLRYWTKYLDDNSLAQHARDLDNFGISGSYQNISPFNGDLVNAKLDILNLNTLALNWNFGLLTGSSNVGGFSVQDYSSGSALLQDNYGWVGAIGGYQLPGSGSNFEASVTDTAKSKTINAFRFIEPERATSADAVQILSEDDKVFGVVETVPSYVYTVEKSMHRAISEEMLDFFAGVVDFNNVIGEMVNRYRGRYKSLEKLREIFFRRVTTVSDVEKFIDYYKWFDDALALVMGQLMPASSEFTADVYNTIESHVLERNKYQTQYPTLETKSPEPMGAIQSIVELTYDYNQGRSPLPGSPRPTNDQLLFWKERALRTSPELSSSNAAVNTQREIYRKAIYSNPTMPTNNPSLNSPSAGQYASNLYARRNFSKNYILDSFISASAFHGGINFGQRKQSELTHNSLYPFGPINTSSNRFIPLNVLLALQSDIVPITDFINTPELRKKRKRYFKVLSGRNYENGLGYYNMKSDMIFPFNLMSSSVTTGYNKVINDRVSGGIELTNLHHDTYGPDMETPMQGTFTQYAVGGHQSRHVAINYSSSTHPLDTYLTRPEAWKILVGECADQGSGALGMAEVNYPYPDVGRAPITASGIIKIVTQPAIGDSVTLGDGDSSLTFAVPFENEKAILFDGGAGGGVVVGGNFSSSLTSPGELVSPIYCKDTDSASYQCTGTPDFYEGPTQTWAAWISQSQSDAGYIFQTGQPHAQNTFWTRTNQKLRVDQVWWDGVAESTVTTGWETANNAFASGEWQHVALVFDASLTGSISASVYVNGTEVGWKSYPGSGFTAVPTGAGSRLQVARFADGTWGTPGVTSGYNCGSPAVKPCNSLRVAATIGGYSNAGVAFTGSIDEMNIWDVSMSADQISELYATGSALNLLKHSLYLADSSNLHSWWRMGDGSNDAVNSSDAYSSANRIQDEAKAGSKYGVPRGNVSGFTEDVVTGSSGGGSDITWTKGASYVVSALNLYTAITGQYASGNLNISASIPVGSGELEVMNLSNTKYGIITSTKREAQGNLGNVDIYQTGSLNTWDGMTGGEGPKIMNYNAPRATYYRGMVAKSPVNIRNLQLKTGSTILGNYQNNYEIVQTVGAFENPRSFVETQPTLPSAITTRGNLTSSDVNSSIVVFNYTALNENNVWGEPDHYKYNLDYLVTNNSGAFENNSIIVSRFGAPGSRETTAHGFQDFRSSEYSPYNSISYRNLSVMKPSQGPSGSEGATTGIRVFDIHGQDYGLYSHRARHAARFGRDSLQVTGTTATDNGPGASYDQLPAMFKVQRNNLKRLKLTSWEADTYTTSSRYDNSNVTHPIPQSDRQYSWITSSVVDENDLYGYLPANFILSTSAGYIDAYDFVSSSGIDGPGLVNTAFIAAFNLGHVYSYTKRQEIVGGAYTTGWTPLTPILNTIIYEPITASTNTLGYPSLSVTDDDQTSAAGYYFVNYIKPTIYKAAATWPDAASRRISVRQRDRSMSPSAYDWTGVASILNSILIKRGDGYGFPSWRQVRQEYHPILRNERANNRISVITSSGEVAQYDLFPVSTRGRPISLNVTQQAGADFTVKSTYNNESIFFTQRQLNDLVGVTNQDVITPYNQIVDITTTSPNYNLNWVLYSQNLFPSVRNEYQSYARERKDYENLFWRDNLEERYTYGSPRRLCYASGDFVRCNYSAVVTVADFSPSQFDTPNQYNQNSLGIPYIGPQYYRVESGGDEQYNNHTSDTFAASALSQSSWPLDPPKNFLSRTTTRLVSQYLQLNPYYGGFNSVENTWDSVNDHRVSGAAGELQNTYVMPLYAFLGAQTGSAVNQNYTNVRNTNRRRLAQASPGALYARKHLISSPGSVTSPSGPSAYALRLNAFGLDRIYNQRPRAFQPETAAYKGQVWIGGGEALWEAGPNAGIFVTSGSASVWQPYPSAPWFNDYDEYKFDLMNVAKDYVIVPEYRMSEHVLDYAKNGVLNPNKHDTFEVVGGRLSSSGEARVMPRRNPIGSAQASFYKDYSNSEFLKDVLKVKQDTLLNAKEIRLVCSAAIRYQPYKGFYPAQRTLDLVSQFSRSYGDSLKATNLLNDADTGFAPNYSEIPGGSAGANWGLYNYGGQNRPALAALFAPGILFNSIKAGIACDYPVVSHGSKVGFTYVSGSTLNGDSMENTSENWLVNVNTGSLISNTTEVSGYSDQDGFFDARFPFETIIRPEEFMMGVPVVDLEPHHLSASFQTTSSLIAGPSDNVYTMMAQNFFGEVGNFFLKDSGFTKLESKPVPGKLTFESGSVYGARIRLRKSHNGRRFYTNDSASWDVYQYGEVQTPWGPLPTYQPTTALNPETVGYKAEGGLGFGPTGGNQASASVSSSGWFELPQDPANMLQFKETFTMYSRPTAFGPALSGRPILNSSYGFMTGANSEKEFEVRYSPMDALNGFNWAYTPPYYHGEAWIDLVFWPSSSREYSPEEVLNESLMNARRFDPGNSVILRNSASLADFCSGCGHGGANLTYGAPYGGANINTNAMQLSASVNYLGIEKVQFTETDQFDNPESRRNIIAGTKWVIQPKFETPMANFSDMGTRPLTASNGTITFPLVASASTSRGMWHQFGILEPDPNKGIFLEIGDIPPNWLQNHYEPRASSSIYNNYNTNTSEIRSTGASLYKEMKSLTDLFGFEKENTSARLGELADSQTIREAIVAIPYLTDEIGDGLTNEALDNASGTYRQSRKKLVSIPQERFEAAKKDQIGSLKGDSFIAAGASIRKQLQKMQRYILPPEFDFLTNPSIDPFVMYMFEFEYTFDKDDLNYMWQNLAPRDYKKIDLQAQSVAHELMDTELLSERNLVGNDTLRWMVFKVKQRSTTKYQDLIAAQASQASNQRFLTDQERRPKPYQFNWPYDYLSLVEMIKMDVEVLYSDDEPAQLTKDEITGEPGMTRKKMVRKSKKKMGLTKGAKGFKAQQEEKKATQKKAIKKQEKRRKRKGGKRKNKGGKGNY